MHRALSLGALGAIAGSLSAGAVVGCDCGGGATSSVETASCSTHDVPLEEARTIGRATLTPDDRRLVITGLPETSRWAVGRGAALSIDPFLPTLDAIEGLEPDGVLVLGALGSRERLDELVTALAELTVGGSPVPVFLVPGPRDRIDELDAALEAHGAPHLISLAGVHVVELGGVALLIASGTVDGSYVLEGACHLDDLDDVIEASDDDHLRVLVGFDAPAGTALTRGLGGVEAGSERVRVALEGAGFAAGLFGGPDTQVGRWMAGDAVVTEVGLDRRVIVPPMSGPALESADGSRAPSGPLLVAIGPAGIGPLPTGGTGPDLP